MKNVLKYKKGPKRHFLQKENFEKMVQNKNYFPGYKDDG